MMTPSVSSDGLNQVVTFIEFHLPGLQAGSYTLNLSQTVIDDQGEQLNDLKMESKYRMAVEGDRFSLAKPAEIIFANFPEDNGSGQYGNVLPHVVFANQTFPWSREPQANDTIKPGRATWLTVLLLDENDFPTGTTIAPVNGKVGDLFPKSVYPDSTLPEDAVSYFRNAQDTSVLELGESVDDSIQYLDLDFDLFQKLAPTLEELHYMAHARRVDLKPKPTIPRVSDIGEPIGDFSIVFGNRLPQAKKKSFAFLVSLEDMGDLLPDDSGDATLPPNIKAIRLAMLSQWSFFTMGAAADFDSRMLALNGRTTGNNPPDARNTNLRLEYSGTNDVVKHALEMGYVPLNQTMRTGEKNVSWYRGPLISCEIEDGKVTIPVKSADDATIFDPTTGLLDESYAASWSVGRLLALQDKGFSTALYAWKKGLGAKVLLEIENESLERRFAALTSALPAARIRAAEARAQLTGKTANGANITAGDLRSLLVHALLEGK
ncbi:MAG TPA: hypothetical protein VE178_11710 [Silvibacterium sp.]|nr:hypothetical protein [Silvibacterium sp.]